MAFCAGRRFDPYLEYVVTYTDTLAYAQAAVADSLFAQVKSFHKDASMTPSLCPTGTFCRSVSQRVRCYWDVQGTDIGPLQGIPYGLKDLISVEGYRTTWGMASCMNQVLGGSAHVYKR